MIMVLESNADILTKLRDYYASLVADSQFSRDQDRRDACQQSVKRFTVQINEIIYNITAQLARAKVLSKLVTDRKVIVSFWNPIERGPSRA